MQIKNKVVLANETADTFMASMSGKNCNASVCAFIDEVKITVDENGTLVINDSDKSD